MKVNQCDEIVSASEGVSVLAREMPYHPVTNIDQIKATQYCRWRGGRLPTKEEWEAAARGEVGYKYPGTNKEPDPRMVNLGLEEGKSYPWSVYKTRNDNVSVGVYGLTGNVSEWTSSEDEQQKYGVIVKGGSFFSYDKPLSSSSSWRRRDKGADFIGFRCVKS